MTVGRSKEDLGESGGTFFEKKVPPLSPNHPHPFQEPQTGNLPLFSAGSLFEVLFFLVWLVFGVST